MKTSIRITSLVIILAFWSFTSKPTAAKKSEHKTSNSIKVALLLDTSNSMDGLIDQAKAQLWEIVNELSYAKHGDAHPDLKIALYEYGNDGLEASDNYIRKVIDFSSDLDLISKKLFSLTTNGGSEYCGAVIQRSLDDLKWGKKSDDLNLIFIAGNEAFTQGRVPYIGSVTNANEKNVTVNTIFCGDYQNGISGMWKDGAVRTGGDYFAIDQNKKQVYVSTPYDEIIIRLNKQLNATYIGYGHEGQKKMVMQKEQDDNAMMLDEEVAVKRAVSKSNRLYKNSSWDLVDASKDKDFKYEELEETALPEELKHKSTEEIEAIVTEKAQKRAEIQEQINVLNVQRGIYVKKQNKATGNDNLSNALIKTIKKQANTKNYEW